MKITTNIDNKEIRESVATIGFFDGVHRGHQFLLQQVSKEAAKRGLAKCVVTFPVHPRQVMRADYQPQMLSTLKEKQHRLELAGMDYCAMLEFTKELASLSAYDFMKSVLREQLNVKVLVIGYDNRFGHNRAEGFEEYCEYGRQIGIEVVKAQPYVDSGINVSSSVTRAFLNEGDVAHASRCLGYDYTLSGHVVKGFQEGRKLGFPTANLTISDSTKLIPADGVYAVRVNSGGNRYAGMLNIGHRPTYGKNGDRSIEVHIVDYDGVLYGDLIEVEFCQRLRDEQRFDSTNELKHQLQSDIEQVRQMKL